MAKKTLKELDEELANEQLQIMAEIFALEEQAKDRRARLTTIKAQRGGIKEGLDRAIVAESKGDNSKEG